MRELDGWEMDSFTEQEIEDRARVIENRLGIAICNEIKNGMPVRAVIRAQLYLLESWITMQAPRKEGAGEAWNEFFVENMRHELSKRLAQKRALPR